MPKPLKLVVTCEHASDFVPPEYRRLIPMSALDSHRGIDFGAEEFAKKIGRIFGAPLCLAKTSRLVADLNRSPHNRQRLFSRHLRTLTKAEKDQILSRYYWPYRRRAEKKIRQLIAQKKRVLHISVHTFTPVLNRKKRTADIGFLFDPSRKNEREIAVAWRALLAGSFKVRFNYPYKGTSDGFTTYLRKNLNPEDYLGIELEMNQKYPLKDKAGWLALQRRVLDSFPL